MLKLERCGRAVRKTVETENAAEKTFHFSEFLVGGPVVCRSPGWVKKKKHHFIALK